MCDIMVRVMASGVFDILHTGHISYLQQAKALGDELIVVVACDATVRKNKHEPITPEKMRVAIVDSLKPVDEAILGKEGDIFNVVREISPDMIVLGFDQAFTERELKKKLEEHGLGHIKVMRATEYAEDLTATRKIVAKIRKLEGEK
ncbi:FAD synthase [Candidatus Methanoplasma termitum]|uniref:RibL protein n=2 Tax=Candidatus Methanoplasma termitum TaxID=1577791 RepID=A0A0A7LBU8_9ARCH|nr:FAD synthase [Candidatus Methanoplasma termitum]